MPNVKITKYKTKKGHTYRLRYHYRGVDNREPTGITIANKDPLKKQKLELLSKLRSTRELQLTEQTTGFTVLKPDTTLVDFTKAFIEGSNLKGLRNYKNTLNYIEVYFKNLYLREIRESDCTYFYNELLRGLAIVTANTYMRCLKKILRLAVREDLIKQSPAKNLRLRPDERRVTKDYFSPQEMGALIKTELCTTDNGLKEASLLAYYTGIGLAEIRKLKAANLAGGILRYNRAKNNNLVRVPIKKEIIPYLPNKSGLLFPRIPQPAYLSHLLKRWAKRAGIDKNLTFYCFRHSFAINLVLSGSNLKTVSRFLGHSSLKHTIKYLEYVEDLNYDAIDRMDSFV